MTRDIKYWYSDERKEYYLPPSPAKQSVPEWYKKIPKFFDGTNKVSVGQRGASNIGVKGCVPFLDALTCGYVVRLHCDILVSRDENNEPTLSWASEIPPVVGRSEQMVAQLPYIKGFSKFQYAWEIPFYLKVPKGYSFAMVHPLNHFELPFISSSGIVDESVRNGAMPFCLNDEFEGIIPAGTPITQIIPFKREDWKVSEGSDKDKPYGWVPTSKIFGWYRENIWKKKNYS
jgi:hypothetical protein